MKNHWALLSLLFLFAATSCSDQYSNRNLKAYSLRGNVKSAVEYRYLTEYVDGKWVTEDESEFLIKNIFSFNEKNECTEEKYILGTGETLQTIKNEYKDGLTSRQTIYDQDQQVKMILIINNIDNDLVEIDMLNPDNTLKEKGKGTYKDGYMMSLIYPGKEYKYTYDKNGDIASFHIVEDFGSLSGEIEILEYDDRGNWTRKVEKKQGFDPGNTIVVRTIEYYD